MDIDADISNWVLEFLLRQPLEDRTLNSLLRVLPLLNDKPSLKKLLLLKKLECEMSRQSVSETTLDVLEQLEEINFQHGVEEVSDTMKQAYCAVAVECTVRVLENGDGDEDGDDYRRFEYFEVMVRVWRGKIAAMEKEVEKGGLGSEDLWSWRDEIEAAVWDDNACKSIKKKREGIKVVEAVNDYLREEWEKLGPSFLELVADRVKDDEVLQRILGVENVDRVARKEAPSESCVLNKDVRDVDNGKVNFQFSEAISGIARNCERNDSVEANNVEAIAGVAGESECHDPVEKNHVEASTGVAGESECHDPVGENRVAAITAVGRESECHDPVEENHVEAINGIAKENEFLDVEEIHGEANLFIVDGAGVVQAIGRLTGNIPRPSLMEENTSVPRNKQYETVDKPHDVPESSKARLRFSSPRVINVSPLKKHENKNSNRRTPKKWSYLEESSLRTGVKKYGKGNWKFILQAYSHIFQERTDVDLKDKWRNLSRRRKFS